MPPPARGIALEEGGGHRNYYQLLVFWSADLFCVKADDIEDDLAGFLHAFEGDELQFAVEVVTACKDVRTRESHE